MAEQYYTPNYAPIVQDPLEQLYQSQFPEQRQSPYQPADALSDSGGFFSNLWGESAPAEPSYMTPATATPFNSAFASYGIPALAAAGTYLGGKGIYDAFKGSKTKTPTDAAARLQAGITTGGLSEIGRLFGLGGGPKSNLEQKRREALGKKGVALPTYRKGSGNVRKDLASDFIGQDPSGQWVNNAFATSRNESNLRPDDLRGSAAVFEKFGSDWLRKGTDEQNQILQGALNSGAVREHHGTIDIDWSKIAPNAAPPTSKPTASGMPINTPGGTVYMRNGVPNIKRS